MNNKIALLAAAVAASTASVSAQAATYEYSGNVTDCYFAFGGAMDACGSLGVVVGDSLTVSFETLVVGSVDNADVYGSGTFVPDRGPNAGQTVARDVNDGARFFIANGSTGAWKLPMIYGGTSNVGGSGVTDTTGLTVDGTDATGGNLAFTSAAGTGQQATLAVDFDTMTWVAYNGVGTSGLGMNFAVGAGNLTAPSAVPVPAAAWLFGSALVGLAGVGRKRAA